MHATRKNLRSWIMAGLAASLAVCAGCSPQDSPGEGAEARAIRRWRPLLDRYSVREKREPSSLVVAAAVHAGGARLSEVKFARAEVALERQGRKERWLISFWPPGRLRADLLVQEPGGAELVVQRSLMLARAGGWDLTRAGPPRTLDPGEQRDLAWLLAMTPLRLLPLASSFAVDKTYLGRLEGQDVDVVAASLPGGGRVILYIDGATHDLVASRHPASSGERVLAYGDFQQVNGVRLPRRVQVIQGSSLVELRVLDLQIDPLLPGGMPAAFFDPISHPFYR